jgi:mRNA interferase RelE/StbE
MKTEFLKQFIRDTDKLSVQSVRNEVIKIIKNVEDSASPTEIKGLKKLSGYKNAFRIKIGDYRIGIFIEKNIVEFARVVLRKDIYKVFP